MFNPATPAQTVHMILAAFMVAGFLMASVYAVAMLRGRRDRYHRVGFLLPFTIAAAITPVQIVVGDWAAHVVVTQQPTKLAAMEGLYESEKPAALHIGGVYVDNELRYAIAIPDALSLLAHWDPSAEVRGLAEVPPDERPPVNPVHLSFQLMVAAGFFLLALGGWAALAWWRRRDLPRSRLFLWGGALSGIAAVAALEAGWVTTEVGRQPWIAYGVMRTADAVNPAPGIRLLFLAALAVYLVLTVASVYVLRRLAGRGPEAPDGSVPAAPQEHAPLQVEA
jgi:cytochrome d ubiquinol oxidase subunit I